MKSQDGKVDPPECREDLVRKAADSSCAWDFDWLDDKVSNRVASDGCNCGLTAKDIRELTREWIQNGNLIRCKPEDRELYRDKRHFWYYVVVKNLAGSGFPRGLFVEMQLGDADEDEPRVFLLNAHPQSREE